MVSKGPIETGKDRSREIIGRVFVVEVPNGAGASDDKNQEVVDECHVPQ